MFMCIFICIFMVSFMCILDKKNKYRKNFYLYGIFISYSFVNVSPMLKFPLQHPAVNPLLVVISYTQTLFEGVMTLLPLFAVIAAVMSVLQPAYIEICLELSL